MGQGAVGKTSLIIRLTTGKCPKEHDPTVEDTYKINLKIKSGEMREFQILDTAGEEDYQNMLDNWISSAIGFVLVFAINDSESFEYLKTIRTRIKKNEAENKPTLIIGNKCDLGVKRKVTVQRAEEFCKSINCKYYETSALEDHNGNVKKAFEDIASSIVNTNWGNEGNKGCCCVIL